MLYLGPVADSIAVSTVFTSLLITFFVLKPPFCVHIKLCTSKFLILDYASFSLAGTAKTDTASAWHQFQLRRGARQGIRAGQAGRHALRQVHSQSGCNDPENSALKA